jgi:preprotein translocase subunit SecE
MSKLRTYIDETRDELFNKVTWPTWSELQESAIIVMVASAIIAAVVWGMDFVFHLGMDKLYKVLG